MRTGTRSAASCQAASRPVIIARKIIPASAQATAVVGGTADTLTFTLLVPPAHRPVTEQERRGILALWQGVRRLCVASVLALACTGPAFAFGDDGLWATDGGSWDSPSSGISQYYTDRQDRHLAQALRDLRGNQTVLPGTTVYPCGFNRGNARAYEACQRDWMANPPDESWRRLR